MSMVITPALQQRIAMICTLVLGFFIAVTFINGSWQLIADWHLTQTITPTTSNQNDQTAALIKQIPAQNIFGQSLSGDMPLTSLQIKVTGIVKMQNEEADEVSKVYISLFGEPSKIYEVGETLPSTRVKIYSITADTVILENDGHLEKLPLPREPLRFKPLPIEEHSNP